MAELKKSTPEELQRGKVEVGLAVIRGEVVIKMAQPTELIVWHAENARAFAEQLARAAYSAKTGLEAPEDMRSVILGEIRDRLTDQLRERMINRFVMMMGSMDRKNRSPGWIAMHLVDAFMREVTQPWEDPKQPPPTIKPN